MENQKEALRALARAIESLRDSLVENKLITEQEARIVTGSLEEFGAATGDSDRATSASVEEFQPPERPKAR